MCDGVRPVLIIYNSFIDLKNSKEKYWNNLIHTTGNNSNALSAKSVPTANAVKNAFKYL